RELALIRAEVAASGPGLGAQLRITCLTLCDGLGNHHRGEDAGIFPMTASWRPDLADAVDRMRDEHERIGELLAEVDRLTGELEDHLRHEEDVLVPVLDGTG